MTNEKKSIADDLEQSGVSPALQQQVASKTKLVDTMSQEMLDNVAAGLAGHLDKSDHWNITYP